MKKLYQELEIEWIVICSEDIITLSPNGKDDTEEDPFGED